MYQVIIVDDEKMIRQSIRSAIPWESVGIRDVFTAGSGAEALKIVREHKPEIMITDIKMDGMTGLELIGSAKKIVPELRALVLSGYDEFEYARECIKLKVYDFFLKPVDENVLIDAIRKQVVSLEEETSEKSAENNEARALAVSEQLKIESFLRKMVGRETPPSQESIADFCKKYHYSPEQDIRVAIIVPILCAESDSDANHYTALSVENICMEMVDAQSRGLTFLDGGDRITIAFFLEKNRKNIYEWVQELMGILKDEFGRKTKIAVGNPVEGFRSLKKSYNDAVCLLQQDTADFSEIIQPKSIRKKDILFHAVFSEFEEAMCSNFADREKILRIFDRFALAADSYNLSDAYLRRCCFKLASSLYYTFMVNSGAEAEADITQFYNGLVIASGSNALELTRQFLGRLPDGRDSNSMDRIIEKAEQFIMEHLSEDLSLPRIASMLFISPNYLSRLFKKSTGEGFNEYIVRNRLEKAKLLLQTTSLKTSQIAALVGYRDTNYFSLAIKKNTGVSPKKYREKTECGRTSLKESLSDPNTAKGWS